MPRGLNANPTRLVATTIERAPRGDRDKRRENNAGETDASTWMTQHPLELVAAMWVCVIVQQVHTLSPLRAQTGLIRLIQHAVMTSPRSPPSSPDVATRSCVNRAAPTGREKWERAKNSGQASWYARERKREREDKLHVTTGQPQLLGRQEKGDITRFRWTSIVQRDESEKIRNSMIYMPVPKNI